MPFRAGARGWMGAASSEVVIALQTDIAALSEQIAAITGSAEQAQRERAQEKEWAAGEVERLNASLATLGAQLDAQAKRAFASVDDLRALQERIERDDARHEELRIKLAALDAQMRWENEEVRKALTAVVERGARKPA